MLNIKTIATSFLWLLFFVITILMIVSDIFIQEKNSKKVITIRESILFFFLWFIMSLVFLIFLFFFLVSTQGKDVAYINTLSFFISYLLEKLLSIDNLFVWFILFESFQIPLFYQRKVLSYGVLGAILLRIIIIFTGELFIFQWNWIIYIFALLLLITAIKILVSKSDINIENNTKIVSYLCSFFRVDPIIINNNFFVRKKKLLFVTPLFIVLILIELSNIVFSMDSIPAIFSITTDPFIILSSNIFSILGLRSLYFILVYVLKNLFLIRYGLALILIVIALKILLSKYVLISEYLLLCLIMTVIVLIIIINSVIYITTVFLKK